jgi:hypothetical protein
MRQCLTCTHTQRAEIESRLARGESSRIIAAAFELPASSVERHLKHVAAVLSQQSGEADALGVEVAQIEAQLTQELTAKIDFLAREAVRLKGVAAQLSDMKTALALIREIKGIYEMRLRAKELERSRPAKFARQAPIDHATARKMAETYLARHHVADRLRELKADDANA